MDFNLNLIIDIFLNTQDYLDMLFSQYSVLAYFILFAIIFLETGLVVTPFLPGDSILFGVGAIAAGSGVINVPFMITMLCVAAIAGDSVNYEIGTFFGHKLQKNQKIAFVKTEYIQRTQAYFQRHGGKTITIARFIPIIRTFAPFVAGAAQMKYSKFLLYNLLGGIFWVFVMFGFGYFFGNLPFVQNNFSLVVIAIIVISLLPALVTLIKNKKKN